MYADFTEGPAWSDEWPRPDELWRGVHVWRIGLQADVETTQSLARHLDAGERQRAQRFRFAADRRRFIVSHGAMRTILARYLDLPPAHVAFETLPYGKPILAGSLGRSALHFNLTHAGELALLATSSAGLVGIDVEKMRPLPDAMAVARQFFAPVEVGQLQGIDDGDAQVRAFYRCWTRKEAFIKAVGGGLLYPLDSFAVTFLPGDEPQVIDLASDSQAPGDERSAEWSMRAFQPLAGYEAAVVSSAPLHELGCFDYRH